LHLILGLAVGLGGGALMLFTLLTIFCLYKRRKGQTLNKGNAEDPAEVVDKDEVSPKLHTSPLKELDSTERDPQMEQAFNRFTQQ
jgi:hypothetical protein